MIRDVLRQILKFRPGQILHFFHLEETKARTVIFLDRVCLVSPSVDSFFPGLPSSTMLKNCRNDGGYRIFWVMM